MDKRNTIRFIYKNLSNEVKEHTLGVAKVFTHHFSGQDLIANRYKVYRKDRVVEYLDNAEEVLALYPIEPFKSPSGGGTTGINPHNPGNLLEVCFTGFRKADKERLTKLAQENRLYVARDVTVNLGILVCGYNAGPKKIERAVNSAQKVEIMNEEEFLHFVETGEVSGE